MSQTSEDQKLVVEESLNLEKQNTIENQDNIEIIEGPIKQIKH